MTIAAEHYRNTQVMTASPMTLVLMLYDECIRSLKQAEEAFGTEGHERFQKINNHVLHAQDIVTELAVSLDMEKGGKVAGSLQRLYEFMASHLSRANAQKTAKPIRDVREMMEELREAWATVADEEPHDNAGQQNMPLRDALATG